MSLNDKELYMKAPYETPFTTAYQLMLKSRILEGSVESMNEVEGSWEEE